MTKRLRKKFILINMLLVGTVLLVVFAAMCVSNYQKLVMDSMKVMERYFDDGGKRPVPKLDFEQNGSGGIFLFRFPFVQWWTVMENWFPTRAII